MLGAVIGDIVGSVYEWNNYRDKNFDFFKENCFYTDDTILTIAICDALLKSGNYKELEVETIKSLRKHTNAYSFATYGPGFLKWVELKEPTPYNSYGNGAAMRVSPVAYVGRSIDEVKKLARIVTKVTHNHKEGIKGAEATAVSVYLARIGVNIKEIEKFINKHYYKIDFTIDSIRQRYTFEVSCQKSVPQALQAFFESYSFEDAIRNAISIGGDSDTIAAIAGSVAGAYYKIPEDMKRKARTYLDKELQDKITQFLNSYENIVIEKH